MGGTNPESILYDINGNPLAVQNATALPTSQPALLIAGSDGTNSRFITIDTSGRPILVGAGTAGTPAGGVLTIQGVSGGTVVPISITGTNTISGTVTANQGTANTAANAWTTLVTDGTNTLGVSAHPLRVDPTGTTTQPVSGTVNLGSTTPDKTTITQTLTMTATTNTVALTAPGTGTAAVQITGATWTGTIIFEATVDSANWFTINAIVPTTGAIVTTTTANGQWLLACAGYAQIRVRCSVTGTNSATVSIEASAGDQTVSLVNSLPTGSNVIGAVTQSAGPWTENLTQIAGSAVSTAATGVQKVGIVGGAGTSLETSAGVLDYNLKNVSNSAVATAATGVQKVGIVGNTGTALDGTTAGILDENIKNVGGSAVVTVATGVQKVGIVGNTGTALDGTTAGILDENIKNVGGNAVVTVATGVQKVGIVGSTGTALDGTTAGVLDENIKNVGGNAVVTVATGVQKVGIVGSTGTALDGTTAGVLDENIKNIGGSAVVTAASGVQKVGIVGNANATVDAALSAGTAPTNGFGALIQYNTSLPAPSNAQTVSLQSDQSGNLLEFPGVQFKTGAAWTSSSALNTLQYPTGTATPGAPTGATAIIIQLDQTTTLTGGAVTFQGTYDGINWVTIPTAQVLNPQTYAQLTNPYTFVASTNQPFLIMLQGFQQIRANLTTQITGTGSVTPYWTVVSTSPISTVAIANGFNKFQGMGADGSAVTGNPNLIAGEDQSGNARIPRVDSTNRQMLVAEAPIAASMGIIGSSPIAETAFGYVATSAKTTVAVRATAYTQISSAPVQVSVKSASASDASAGTGVRTITITYLTTGLVRKTETITMNGTTAVNSVGTDYAFIEKVVSSTAGSGRTNAGIITVFSGTGGTGTALCSIAAGDGRTNFAHHYVTTGKSCYITQITIASNGGSNALIQFQLTNNSENDILEPIMPSFRSATQQANFTAVFNPPIKVPESDITNGNLIIAYITPDATTATNWYISFSYFEV